MKNIFKFLNVCIFVVTTAITMMTLIAIYVEGVKGNVTPPAIYVLNLVCLISAIFTGGNSYLLIKGEQNA